MSEEQNETKAIKSKSRTAKLVNDTLGGTKKGLKIGLALGLGAGLFFAGAGLLFFGVGVTAAVTAVAVSTVNTAIIGTAVGAAYGALKGLFTATRPKGDMGLDNDKGARDGIAQDEPQRGQSAAPQLPSNEPVFAQEAAAPAPAAHGQSSQAELQQLRQLTEQLNASRAQPADWQARVNRERAAATQGGPAIG